MTPPAIKARLNFLVASAHLYSFAAPATSAHLMLECDRVATSHGMEMKETEPKPACGVCGTILVPGRTSRKFIAGPRRSTKKARPKSRNGVQTMQGVAPKLVISKCLVCRRSTKTQLTAKRSGVSGTKSPGARPLPPAAYLHEASPGATNPTGQEAHKLPSANLSSKKRAKARKQGGLQAMLEKSKSIEAHSSGFGLELMDLMKKS